MSNSDKIASLALIISFLAFILSIMGYLVSRKTLSIDKQQHDERNLAITLYYIDAYKWRKDDITYISFALRFTNQSTLNNAISKIELHIEFYDKNNISKKVKVAPDTLVTPINLKNYSDILKQPFSLPEKSAISGWITFKLPTYLKDQPAINIYEVHAETIDKKTISIDTHIVNEV